MADAPPEHLDILIVGAGISGIGAACRFRERLSGRRIVVLEGRERIGGTDSARQDSMVVVSMSSGMRFLRGTTGDRAGAPYG